MPMRMEIQPKIRCFILLPSVSLLPRRLARRFSPVTSWRSGWPARRAAGVAGIWMLRTPSGHSASMMAFMTVGVEPDRAGLADTLGADRIALGRHRIVELVVEVREGLRARHRIVHERAGDELTALAVVDILLEQRLADALGAAAMDLAEHDRPVQRLADVVDRRVALAVPTMPVSGSISTSPTWAPFGQAMPSTAFTFSM